MEKYIGIGILFLCMTPVIGIICAFGYKLVVSKEKIEVTRSGQLQYQSNNLKDKSFGSYSFYIIIIAYF